MVYKIFAFWIFSLTLSCNEERIGEMVNGYCEVYHDRSYIDIHFWRVLAEMVIYVGGALTVACTLGWGLYLLRDKNKDKKEDE